MFKTKVTYKDFNEKQHTEEIYFHLMVTDLVDLEFSTDFSGQTLSDFMRHTMSSGDPQKIYTFFKIMILHSYGRRSEDGSEFVRSPEFTQKFMNSQAYESFFVWLITNPENAQKFWDGIMPERLSEAAAEIEAKNPDKKKITEMSREELVALMQAKVNEKVPANEVP